MIYLSTCICVCMYICWSLLFCKYYQLNSYKIKEFFINIYQHNIFVGNKNKIVFTKRMTRFIVFLGIIAFLLFFLINFYVKNIFLIILDYLVMFIFCPLIVGIAHMIILPLENLIKKIYMFKAERKLKRLNIIKIAITGSFGKTSTKNILTEILEKEFKVCQTPQNYNTEMGITKTILEKLDDHDIVIFEMGARTIGDIKKLVKFTNPNYGIMTPIGKQHLETFKSLENIEKTKNELPEYISGKGIMIFNGKSKSNITLYNNFTGEKYLTCKTNSFAYAKNITVSEKGSEFDMVIDNHILHIKTMLMGSLNIDNIVTASALAYIIGIKDDDIISAIKKLKPVGHRLELLENNHFSIIDDSYNSNEVGFTEALDVLSKFQGQKIVITPGVVEMGDEQSSVNFRLGAKIADVADFIIIMNETNKNYLLSGAISHNFDRKNIFFCNSREKQQEILKLIVSKGCVVLFENDLPDNYK